MDADEQMDTWSVKEKIALVAVGLAAIALLIAVWFWGFTAGQKQAEDEARAMECALQDATYDPKTDLCYREVPLDK